MRRIADPDQLSREVEVDHAPLLIQRTCPGTKRPRGIPGTRHQDVGPAERVVKAAKHRLNLGLACDIGLERDSDRFSSPRATDFFSNTFGAFGI